MSDQTPVRRPTDTRDPTTWPEPTTARPDIDTLMEWSEEGGCEATDGCWVEPDGSCPHGHVAWMIFLRMI